MSLNVPEPSPDLRVALRVADSLDALTISRYRALDLQVTSKPDATPVSDADTAAETLAREQITAEFPGDDLLGEEFGGQAAREGRQWIIDPIDGTKNFVRGVPVWASLIALAIDGVPHVGVVSAPALGRRWYAATGHGAWVREGGHPRRIGVSQVARLEDASLAYSSLHGWRAEGRDQAFAALMDRVWRTRGYGDFWSYMLVAEGAVDIATEPELALHDMAALVPIVREAGGRFTSLTGHEGPHGTTALATNGHLHDAVLAALTAR